MPAYSIGRIRVTSTSKTRKIILTKKNFMQKGNRLIPAGSNPHSNGEPFSLSHPDLKVKTEAARSKPAMPSLTTA